MEQTEEYIKIRGTVETVIFRNENNGYAVLLLTSEQTGEQISVTGILPDISSGEELELIGKWAVHPSYGEQFAAISCDRKMPATESGICAYLASGTIKGIGEKTARAIVEKFGTDAFDVIADQPEKLAQIKGISFKKAYEISTEFKSKAALRRVTEMFLKYGVPPQTAPGVYSLYGNQAENEIVANPYLLCDQRWNIDFGIADRMAADFDIGQESPIRLSAGILYELSFNLQNGHSFIPRGKLLRASASLLGADEQSLEEPLERLENDGRIIRESICGEDAIYLVEVYNDEVFVARSINARLDFCAKRRIMTDRQVEAFLTEGDIEYSDEQKRAIMLAASNGVLVLTGGPGTGKTTTLRGMLEMFERCGLKTVLAAPTGRAANRMSELCGGEQAKTIHRLLEAGYSSSEGMVVFCKNEQNTIDADVVIIDETSMLDIRIGAALLRALKPETRIVFVGDPDQLPPIGPGSMLNDLLCGVVPNVRLTKIFRQASSSDIIMNAHKINRGEMPDLSRGGNDFYFISRSRADDIVSTVVKLVAENIPNRFGIEREGIQVISPWRRREAGTVALNRALADRLNPPEPGKNEYRAGGLVLREDDRVMQIKNDYDLVWQKDGGAASGTGVFNGDIGKILCIDAASEQIVVKYDDKLVAYPFASANELELAYAVTVHKAQGSEFDAVIFAAAANGAERLLTRSILYTAVTRAKKLLVIIGREQTVEKMISNNRKDRRYSALYARLG